MAAVVEQLAALDDARIVRVIVTLNQPEPELERLLHQRAWSFDLQTVKNQQPLGFGANHNRAFALDTRLGASITFAVVNPDIRLCANPFDPLLRRLERPDMGVTYPVQMTPDGRRQDHERLLPTPMCLLRRYLPGAPRREVRTGQRPDWVNAAFLLLRREAYASVGGFDERYHMYGEDVDLCLRLQLAGWDLDRVDQAVVVHEAQRASHRKLTHMVWHVQSLLRLWCSPAWRSYRAKLSASRSKRPPLTGSH